jgi:acetylornithine deacetylase/succinyl-diaminopimelate desuccinylase-like protein
MVHGSQWIVRHHPEIFHGAKQAIGEVGGFSVNLSPQQRLYPIQTAEKGIAWLRLRARQRAGHGSLLHPDNAVSEVARAVARIADHDWPVQLTPTVTRFLEVLSEVTGQDVTHTDQAGLVEILGTLGLLVGATMQNTANPTMLAAGYKVNVIPNEAEACIDGRFLPGHEASFDAAIQALVGSTIEIEIINRDIAVEANFEAEIVGAMAEALRAHDGNAIVAPYMISGGTDAKALSSLGIACYGFSPLQLPAGLDYWRLFHGVDERVPIAGLQFGVDALDTFLRTY